MKSGKTFGNIMITKIGKVIKKRICVGSKSERDALILIETDQEFILQQEDGNPFQDTILDFLDGLHIRCEGVVRNNKFIISTWKEIQ